MERSKKQKKVVVVAMPSYKLTCAPIAMNTRVLCFSVHCSSWGWEGRMERRGRAERGREGAAECGIWERWERGRR